MTTSATVPPGRKRAPAAAAAPAPSAGHDAALLRLLVWLPLLAALLLVRYQEPLRAWASRPHGTFLDHGARVVAAALQPVAIRWLSLAVAVACGVLLLESLWAVCMLSCLACAAPASDGSVCICACVFHLPRTPPPSIPAAPCSSASTPCCRRWTPVPGCRSS